MKALIRIIIAVSVWAVIYAAALYGIPALKFIVRITHSTALSKADFTQLTLLIVSLLLLLLLGRGSLSQFGFRGVKLGELLKPALFSLTAVFLMFILMNIAMVSTGMAPESAGRNSALEGSFLKIVLSVWITASVCEEIFHRGLIYGLLEPLKERGIRLGKIRLSLPVIIPAFLFGLGHLCLLNRMADVIVTAIVVAATLLGFIAGYYREKTGSLIPAIAAHITFNIVGYGIPALMMKMMGS